MALETLKGKLYFWITNKLPTRLIGFCAIRVLGAATSGKYENTIVPELPALEAAARWSRIHGHGGSGEDEFYDSNRNRKKKEGILIKSSNRV